jgi:hypothetical protein
MFLRHLPVLPAGLPSASKLSLAAHCAHAWTSGAPWPADVSGDEAQVGNVAHRAGELEVAQQLVDVPALAKAAELSRAGTAQAEVLAGYVADFIRDEVADGYRHLAEIPLAYDLETDGGRVLPSSGQRDYSARRPTEIVGTVDILARRPAKFGAAAMVVRDWKTGQQAGTDPAAKNWQLATLGLAAARALDVDEVIVELAFVHDEGVRIDRAELGPWELAEHGHRLADLVEGMAHGPTPPQPGPWCVEAWCPLRTVCPATRGALAAIVREDPLDVVHDQESARRALAFLQRAKPALEGLEEAIKAFARREPIDLGDGRVYAWREKTRRDLVIDKPEQRAAIEAVLGPHAAAAIELSYDTSIAAIERGARAKLAAEGKKRGVGKLRDAAIAALAKVGGVTVARWESADAFKRGGQELEAEAAE